MVRVLVLLALLLPVRPMGFRLARAINAADWQAAVWPWLALVAIPVVFVAVASAGRGRRHPPWLLAGEGLLAAAVAVLLVVPGGLGAYVFGGGQPSGTLDSLAGLVEALGLTQGRSWFAPVLALAWVVVVVDAAGRQLRGPVLRRAPPQAN